MCEFSGISVENFPEHSYTRQTFLQLFFAVRVCELSVRYSGDL